MEPGRYLLVCSLVEYVQSNWNLITIELLRWKIVVGYN
jgi:hypothetical protein